MVIDDQSDNTSPTGLTDDRITGMSATTTIADSWMTVDDTLEPEPLVLHVPDELVARRTAEAAAPEPAASPFGDDTFVLLRPVRRAV